jgi:hypothetical protein
MSRVAGRRPQRINRHVMGETMPMTMPGQLSISVRTV